MRLPSSFPVVPACKPLSASSLDVQELRSRITGGVCGEELGEGMSGQE